MVSTGILSNFYEISNLAIGALIEGPYCIPLFGLAVELFTWSYEIRLVRESEVETGSKQAF